ncbi:MAG: helix-turn-helix domain-containing protein [Oscillospiraceae bacterium]|jgi:transcriptional regulator with XRE-family HTH domain|nr:helix-turn-helix domain-containing protein [Oscillospiraceae bacterium]
MTYQKRIKDLREDNDLAQKQVAAILRVSQQTYSSYELNKRLLSIDDLIVLCKFYHVSADYILGFTDVKKDWN